MAIRTSISFTTSNIQDAVKEVSSNHHRGNVSAYLEGLVIEDLIKRGYSRQELLNGQQREKETSL